MSLTFEPASRSSALATDTAAQTPSRAEVDHNIFRTFERIADALPGKTAVVLPRIDASGGPISYAEHSFSELKNLAERYASGLWQQGIRPEMKAVVLIKPGLDFIALALAFLKLGVVPVLVDGGMGPKNMLDCIQQAQPDILVGIPQVFVLKWLRRAAFSSVRFAFIHTDSKITGGMATLRTLQQRGDGTAPTHWRRSDEMILLLFTSGSTGAPKGVVYTPGIVAAQLEVLKATFQLTPEDVDMPIIPALVIATLSLGMTVVIPPIDPVKPMTLDPRVLAAVLGERKVTFSFGSPAVWGKIIDHCLQTGTRLLTLKHLLIAGAPTNAKLLRRIGEVVPNGRFCTPLGATECTPITNICSDELDETLLRRQESGAGCCVGRPTLGQTIRVIAIADQEIRKIEEATLLEAQEIGEIVVKGAVVTRAYYKQELATRRAKILDTDGAIWHRTGDVGYFDREGRLWFCGRKAHICRYRDNNFYSVKVEHCFNSIPGIARVALVNVTLNAEQVLALCVELEDLRTDRQAKTTILACVRQFADRRGIPLKFVAYYPKPFPVDKRHNAKIERHILAEWAQRAVGTMRYRNAVFEIESKE